MKFPLTEILLAQSIYGALCLHSQFDRIIKLLTRLILRLSSHFFLTYFSHEQLSNLVDPVQCFFIEFWIFLFILIQFILLIYGGVPSYVIWSYLLFHLTSSHFQDLSPSKFNKHLISIVFNQIAQRMYLLMRTFETSMITDEEDMLGGDDDFIYILVIRP